MPKGKSGIKRGGGKASAERKTSGEVGQPKVGGTIEIGSTSLDIQDSAYLEKLEAMSKRNELPARLVDSSLEVPKGQQGPSSARGMDHEKFYEEIDRLYPEPPGEMGKYHVRDLGSRADIEFEYDSFTGEEPSPRYPLGQKSSDRAKAGAVKYAIYRQRGALELAALSRAGDGYGTLEMAQKWGGRLLSDSEKAAATREMEAHIQRVFKSPLSRAGRELNDSMWRREKGGWRRVI